MRKPIFLILLFGAAAALPLTALARQLLPAVKQLHVHASGDAQALECEKKPPTPRPAAPPNPDPMEIPTDALIETMLPQALPATDAPPAANAPQPAVAPSAKDGLRRIAIWGDSHLAAAFFSDELAKLLKFPTDSVANALIPANMGRAGVRLPMRRSCVSPQWKYEPAYLGGDGAAAPGPGLVNMFSEQARSTLSWDLRKDTQSPGYERVRIMYQQTETPMVVGISVDGDAEQTVTLAEKAGPAVLELLADQPMTQLALRLIDGRFRFHGLELLSSQSTPFALDVFGYPGATVAGWKAARLDYLSAWFAQRDYQLVVLEFGTNEGNVKPFDLATYRKTLSESVRAMKTLFPGTACLLIGPGDRGVLVRRSANLRKNSGKNNGKNSGKNNAAGAHGPRKTAGKHSQTGKATTRIDLLDYARIHAEIGRVQAELAAEAGCSAWSMQDAMGGPGHAYQWARQAPPWMAPDLIHFTVAGYQRLAQKLARDMAWTAPPGER